MTADLPPPEVVDFLARHMASVIIASVDDVETWCCSSGRITTAGVPAHHRRDH
jgi:hypothetical protein